jgi:hypothetical protein
MYHSIAMAGAYTDASTESWNAAFLVNDGDDTRTVSSLSFTDISDGHMTGATAQDQHRIVEHSIDPWVRSPTSAAILTRLNIF